MCVNQGAGWGRVAGEPWKNLEAWVAVAGLPGMWGGTGCGGEGGDPEGVTERRMGH